LPAVRRLPAGAAIDEPSLPAGALLDTGKDPPFQCAVAQLAHGSAARRHSEGGLRGASEFFLARAPPVRGLVGEGALRRGAGGGGSGGGGEPANARRLWAYWSNLDAARLSRRTVWRKAIPPPTELPPTVRPDVALPESIARFEEGAIPPSAGGGVLSQVVFSWAGNCARLLWWAKRSETMVVSMDRRASQMMHVQVAGQRYKVVSSSSQAELSRLAAAVDAKLAELGPRGGAAAPQSIVLAAIALAHDLEQERAKRQLFEVKIRDLLRRILVRIDSALESPTEGEGSRSE